MWIQGISTTMIVAIVPLRHFALGHGLKAYQAPPRTLKNWELPSSDFDLGIAVSFGYFLPSRIIRSFRKGTLNVHPSLLPRYFNVLIFLVI